MIHGISFLLTGSALVVALIAWTILIRIFPQVLGTAVIKKIENIHATKLKTATAELDARYATLGSSIDYLATHQAELRSRTISSVESMWEKIHKWENEFRILMVPETIMTPKEIADMFRSGANARIATVIDQYRSEEGFFEKMGQLSDDRVIETERLYSGERLWLLYSAVFGVYGRLAYLTHTSFASDYRDWRKDQLMEIHLSSALSEEQLTEVKTLTVGGLPRALTYIKAAFLKEAMRVMSGSKSIADSLADIQATLLSEKQRLDTYQRPAGS